MGNDKAHDFREEWQDMSLTDEQCDEFRRLQMPFNDMVRAIYEAGEDAMDDEIAPQVEFLVRELTIACSLLDKATACSGLGPDLALLWWEEKGRLVDAYAPAYGMSIEEAEKVAKEKRDANQ